MRLPPFPPFDHSGPRTNVGLFSYQSPSHPPFCLIQGIYSGETGTDLQVKSSNSQWSHNEAFPSRGFSTVTPQMTAGNGIFWKDQNKSRVVNGLSFRQRQCARFHRLEGHDHITMSPLSALMCAWEHTHLFTQIRTLTVYPNRGTKLWATHSVINSLEVLANRAVFQWFSSGILFIPVCQGLVWCMPLQILHSWFDSVSG